MNVFYYGLVKLQFSIFTRIDTAIENEALKEDDHHHDLEHEHEHDNDHEHCTNPDHHHDHDHKHGNSK